MSDRMLSMDAGRAHDITSACVSALQIHGETEFFKTVIRWICAQIAATQAEMVDCAPSKLETTQARLKLLTEQYAALTYRH